jgi:hypothetical protein
MTSKWESIIKFLLVFKVRFLMHYDCMLSCKMLALYAPHQKKSAPNIVGVRIVGGELQSSPYSVLTRQSYTIVVSVPVENTTNIYNHTSPLIPCHIPKFPFRNVNRFPKETQNFLKDFVYFHLK